MDLGLDDRSIRVAYLNMAGMNKVRAWARKNKARVVVSRYTTDAYDGHVFISSPWNVGREQTDAKVADLKALLASLSSQNA